MYIWLNWVAACNIDRILCKTLWGIILRIKFFKFKEYFFLKLWSFCTITKSTRVINYFKKTKHLSWEQYKYMPWLQYSLSISIKVKGRMFGLHKKHYKIALKNIHESSVSTLMLNICKRIYLYLNKFESAKLLSAIFG